MFVNINDCLFCSVAAIWWVSVQRERAKVDVCRRAAHIIWCLPSLSSAVSVSLSLPLLNCFCCGFRLFNGFWILKWSNQLEMNGLTNEYNKWTEWQTHSRCECEREQANSTGSCSRPATSHQRGKRETFDKIFMMSVDEKKNHVVKGHEMVKRAIKWWALNIACRKMLKRLCHTLTQIPVTWTETLLRNFFVSLFLSVAKTRGTTIP